MASFKYTFNSGDNVTPERLNDVRDVFDIVNADIKSDAAIEGTKIAPDFGAQNVSANGSFAAQASTGTGDCFIIGNDAKLVDISAANTCALYGLQDATKGSLKLGSGGGTISGASSNIGVNTLTPATTLDVNGDVTITDKIIHSGDTNTAIRFPAADTVAVETGGTERMRIDDSGNVGIGTTTMSQRLNVEGSIHLGPGTALRYISTTSEHLAFVKKAGGPFHFYFRKTDDGTVDGANSTDLMVITDGGNVGIGTGAPSSRLHVAGDLTVSSATTATTATAGSNGDVPAQVEGYLVVSINGTSRKIPYYAT